MAAGFLFARFDDGVNAGDAGVELFGDALDDAALAGGVGAFKDEDDVAFAFEDLALKVEQVELEILNPLAVLGLVLDLLGEVEFAEQAGHRVGARMSAGGPEARKFRGGAVADAIAAALHLEGK